MPHPFHCIPQLLELISQHFILSGLKAGLLQRQFSSLEGVHVLAHTDLVDVDCHKVIHGILPCLVADDL